jgi:hypothetical protein
MEIAIAYFSLCLATAVYGRNCRIGFFGVLLFAALVTPLLVFYGLLGLRPATDQPKKEIKQATKSWWKLK